jgi:hypothetical protein
MKAALFVFGLIISLTVVGFGQVRTITNATLEKFQQKRLAAEKDYRDNYERLGFPSPEELDRQRDADMEARLELAEQLRQARLEEERLELERQNIALEREKLEYQTEMDRNAVDFDGGYWGGFGFGGFGGFDGRDRFGKFRRGFRGRFPSNRLLPTFDRGTYRYTPFGAIRVPNARPAIVFRGGRGFRGHRR